VRIERLELIAFGHFAGTTLDFARPKTAEAGFELVYGHNEAGKSTALRAIRAALYGFPQQSSDAYQFATSDLRVGVECASEDGQRIYIVRRKGRKNTLLDRAGAPLDERHLGALLGGADEALFCTLFGLDHETLRLGAESLLSAEGNAAETLFGASLGAGSLRHLLQDLARQADELFTSKGRSKRINQQLAELKRLKAQVQAESVSPSLYAQSEAELASLRADEAELLTRRNALRVEKARLERQLRVLPLLAQRAAHREQARALGPVVDLPRDSAERRVAAERADVEAKQKIAHERAEIERAEQRLLALDYEPELLAIEPAELEALSSDLGQHNKAQADLPKREGELKSLQAEALQTFRSLGSEVPFERAEELRLPEQEQDKIRRLCKEKTQFETKLLDHAGKLKRVQSALSHRRKEAQRERSGVDTGPLALAVARASRNLTVEPALREARAREKELIEHSEALLGRLHGYEGAPAELSQLPVPSNEEVAQFERSFERLQQRAQQLTEQREQTTRRAVEVRLQLHALAALSEVPTRARLSELRRLRDAHLDELGARPLSSDELEALRRSIQESDSYADTLLFDAERVTRRAALDSELATLEEHEQRYRVHQAEQELLRAQLIEQWKERWRPCHVEPREPLAMLTWLRAHAEALQTLGELQRQRQRVAALEEQRLALVDELDTQLQKLSEPGRQLWEQTLAALFERAEQTLNKLQGREQKHADLVRQLELEEQRALELEEELSELKEQEKLWRVEWHKALRGIGLERDAGPDEVLAVLERLTALFHKLREVQTMQTRITGMQRDSERLDLHVRRLLTPGLQHLQTQPLELLCEGLLRAARRARTHADESQRLQAELAQRHARLRQAEAEQQRAEAELSVLMQRAGVGDLVALQRAEETNDQLRVLQEWVRDLEDKIVAMGEGAPLSQLIEQTAGADADLVRQQIADLEPQLHACEEALDERRAQAARVEQQLLRMQTGAQKTAEELAACSAELQQSIQRYLRLRLASELLNGEIEQFQKEHQGPVLSWASELFGRLTLGAYAGLQVGYDAKDEQILYCIRHDQREVPVSRLSDGARDQLYLALRLASLRRYLEQHSALPLVLDDLLVHFDDERAAAALACLGELAKGVQVLFFTHHRRLIELAQATLPASLLRVHELSAPAREQSAIA
jgi:uncharacterized protein YhaN